MSCTSNRRLEKIFRPVLMWLHMASIDRISRWCFVRGKARAESNMFFGLPRI